MSQNQQVVVSGIRLTDGHPSNTTGNEGAALRVVVREFRSAPNLLLVHQPIIANGDASGDTQSPQQTLPDTRIKTNDVASPGPLAINALKGNFTVGQKNESGFILPHEELCIDNGSYLNVLVLITTAHDHKKYRTAIRQTWRGLEPQE